MQASSFSSSVARVDVSWDKANAICLVDNQSLSRREGAGPVPDHETTRGSIRKASRLHLVGSHPSCPLTVEMRLAHAELSKHKLVAHGWPIASPRVGGSESHAGLLFNHQAFGVSEITGPREFMAKCSERFLRVA